MSADLQATVLILGLTIVPWLIWALAHGRRGAAGVDTEPEWFATGLAGPEDAFRAQAMRQVRPDGVVLDWREESSVGNTQVLSVGTATQPTSRR